AAPAPAPNRDSDRESKGSAERNASESAWADFDRALIENLADNKSAESPEKVVAESPSGTALVQAPTENVEPASLASANEGGMVELLAADEPPVAAPVATADVPISNIGKTEVRMDSGVAVYQAFELGSTPMYDDPTGESSASDSSDLPDKPVGDAAN